MTPRANAVISLIIVLLFGILTGVLGYWLGSKHLVPVITLREASVESTGGVQNRVGGAQATPSPTPTTIPSPTPAIDPTTVIDTFMKNFAQATPPNTNGPTAQTARDQLTTDAQKSVTQASSTSIAAGLAKFAGVQSIPDGYTLGKPTIADSTATIASTWNYISGPVTKVFYLTIQNGQWKIDTIRSK